MDRNGLEDIRATGLFFTWQNNNYAYFILRKIDRAIVNDSWTTCFPNASPFFQVHATSDHSPIVNELGVIQVQAGKCFKFFNHWTKFPEYLPLVEKLWQNEIQGTTMYKIYAKFKMLKVALKELQVVKRKELEERSKSVYGKMEEIQGRIDESGLCNPSDLHLLNSLKQEALRIDCLEEEEAKQKSRINWLRLGDKNTAYFHKKIKQMRILNNISTLKNRFGEEFSGNQ